MKNDPITSIESLLDRFQPNIGKEAAVELENVLESLATPVPDILSIFTKHKESSAREAVAVVAGRLRGKLSDTQGGR